MQFFDPKSREIVVSRDFSITQLKFEYGSKKVLKKDPITLPMSEVSPLHYKPSDSIIIEPLLTSTTTALDKPKISMTVPIPPSPPAIVEQVKNQPNLTNQTNQQGKTKKGYTYVPHYSTSPRNIERGISATKIITKTNRNQQKGQNTTHLIGNSESEDETVMLNEAFPISEAMSNKEELQHWKDAMEEEFKSLTTKNTGTLVPPPKEEKLSELYGI
ncbi:hypothetical protein O181_007727 [Austropuccinia psidii MF-1]|uniref:Uncharacterized protein n=1 Tax=Austropuccinia psidii MF-1 TaxID=1389203 RepID=A0A9Q3GIS0_9BASI|nr:hypothetical protein [Austropuccinia psidii MF-1]